MTARRELRINGVRRLAAAGALYALGVMACFYRYQQYAHAEHAFALVDTWTTLLLTPLIVFAPLAHRCVQEIVCRGEADGDGGALLRMSAEEERAVWLTVRHFHRKTLSVLATLAAVTLLAPAPHLAAVAHLVALVAYAMHILGRLQPSKVE